MVKDKNIPATQNNSCTDMQIAFVDAYLANGGNAAQAIITAGYKGEHSDSRGSQELGKPHVRALLRDKALELLDTKLVAKAIATLDQLLDGKAEDVKARVAKDILDRSGVRKKDKGSGGGHVGEVNVLVDLRGPTSRNVVDISPDGTQDSTSNPAPGPKNTSAS